MIERFPGGDDVAAVEPLQNDARKYQMRGGRTDIDADAQDDDLIFLDERAPGAGEKNAAAFGLVAAHDAGEDRAIPQAPTNFGTTVPFL